jgi:hypothetical protein
MRTTNGQKKWEQECEMTGRGGTGIIGCNDGWKGDLLIFFISSIFLF